MAIEASSHSQVSHEPVSTPATTVEHTSDRPATIIEQKSATVEEDALKPSPKTETPPGAASVSSEAGTPHPTSSLPTSAPALVRTSKNPTTLALKSHPLPALPLPPGKILVRISYTGFCGSDKSLLYDEWAPLGADMRDVTHGIAGHEGAGHVVAVADDVKDLWKEGDRAGIKWVAEICERCEFCTNGTDELHCPRQLNSGLTTPGTFQRYVLTSARYATPLPDGLPLDIAAPLLCGGVTAYVACKRSAVRPGQWLVLPGAGGGLGHLAVQYAKAMGMRVIAVDGGPEKGELCRRLGAEVYVDFMGAKVKEGGGVVEAIKAMTGGVGAHGVVVTAASKSAYADAPMMLRPGGTVVVVGLPADMSVVAGAPPFVLAIRRISVVGSLTGTRRDVAECLDFSVRGLVKPILTHGTLEDVEKFCHMMKEGKLVGRAVLKVDD